MLNINNISARELEQIRPFLAEVFSLKFDILTAGLQRNSEIYSTPLNNTENNGINENKNNNFYTGSFNASNYNNNSFNV